MNNISGWEDTPKFKDDMKVIEIRTYSRKPGKLPKILRKNFLKKKNKYLMKENDPVFEKENDVDFLMMDSIFDVKGKKRTLLKTKIFLPPLNKSGKTKKKKKKKKINVIKFFKGNKVVPQSSMNPKRPKKVQNKYRISKTKQEKRKRILIPVKKDKKKDKKSEKIVDRIIEIMKDLKRMRKQKKRKFPKSRKFNFVY